MSKQVNTEIIVRELQQRFGMVFTEAIYLEDEARQQHLFFVATIRGAKVHFDEFGQLWMNQAEIGRMLGMRERVVQNAITRLRNSELGKNIGQVHDLFTHDLQGRRDEVNFYDEETVAVIIIRSNNPSENALTFLKERKAIIQVVRQLVFELSELSAEITEKNRLLREKADEVQRFYDLLMQHIPAPQLRQFFTAAEIFGNFD